MRDQADKLRQIVVNMKNKQNSAEKPTQEVSKNTTAHVITVTSGKGGVGKTNISVNLAIALSEMGLRVVILDADLGLANIDVLFGIIPKFTLVDVIQNNKSILEVLADGPSNIKFISGGSGVEELVKLDSSQLEGFIKNISLLDKFADIILIDTGAGLSDNVMSFVMAADEVLLVTTPEPTSITDAYALIKMVANRDKDKVIKLIVNRVESANEAKEITDKLSAVSKRFLDLKIDTLGYVIYDDFVIKAVKMQQPFTLSYPKSQAAKLVREMSQKLVDSKDDHMEMENSGFKGFISKLVKLLNI